MDNIDLMATSSTSPDRENQPSDPQSTLSIVSESAIIPTVETTTSTVFEPVSTVIDSVEQTNVDGNVQAHIDVKYEAHDVALASTKANGHQQNSGLKTSEHHKIDIVDSDQHPDKSKSSCILLNKLYLLLAILFFALLLCSIIYIILYQKPFDTKNNRSVSTILNYFYTSDDGYSSPEKLIDEPFFNLKHPTEDGITVVLSRRGASVHDILIPYKDETNSKRTRSIVIKGSNENYFGSILAGFNDPNNTMNTTNQLPSNHPFLNLYKEDWQMYVNVYSPSRVRFVHNSVQVIYEFSSANPNEFMMRTIVSPSINQPIVADLTNNIYFNLRGYGNLSTHYLNLTSSNPIDILTAQKLEQNRLTQAQQVDKLSNINRYFYKFDRVGIGKNYIATLFENETRTTMRVFSDHTGIIIDPFGVGTPNQYENRTTTLSDMRGVRISPRQSPFYQPVVLYGPTYVVYPSEAIHTTWWQFDYKN